MKRKTFFTACMVMVASIIPFSSIMVANDNTPKEEKVITLTNKTNNASNDATLKVPVIATMNNQVLNVQFTGTVPVATVKVNNALTGETVSQQTLTAVQGVTCTVPVAGVSFGTITVTNEQSGESVSGDFEVNNSKE